MKKPATTAQPGLFGTIPAPQPMPPHVKSATSRAAAVSMQRKAGAQSRLVLDFIRARGATGATRHEIADGLRIPLSSVCARVSEHGGLMPSGLVKEQGTRKGPYGNPVAVLVAVGGGA